MGFYKANRGVLEATMRHIPARICLFLVSALAISACSGIAAGPSLADPDALSLLQPSAGEVKKDRLYVSSLPAIREYAVSGNRYRPLCVNAVPPTSYVWGGIGVNATHLLYVPVFSLHEIFTFAANCGPAGPTLSDPAGGPVDVAFDNKLGIVYVSDASGCVEVYEDDATSPTRRLCESGFTGAYSVAVRSDDVYATVFKLCDDQIYECSYLVRYPHGRQKGARVLPLTEEYFDTTVGITFDLKGNLLAFSYLGEVMIYPPPYQGTPSRWCTVEYSSEYGALDSSNKLLYTSAGGGVAVFSYPSCKYKYFIAQKSHAGVGVAVDTQSGTWKPKPLNE
jgi:hypothetical protein